MIDRAHPTVSISRQCHLLEVSRASVYRRPAPVSADDLRLMEIVVRQYPELAFYRARPPGDPQAPSAPEAVDGIGSDLPAPQRQQAGGRAHQVSLPPGRADDRS